MRRRLVRELAKRNHAHEASFTEDVSKIDRVLGDALQRIADVLAQVERKHGAARGDFVVVLAIDNPGAAGSYRVDFVRREHALLMLNEGNRVLEVDQVETAPPAPAFHVLAYTPNVLVVRVEVPPGFPSEDAPRMLN